jgi:hypothetical protein
MRFFNERVRNMRLISSFNANRNESRSMTMSLSAFKGIKVLHIISSGEIYFKDFSQEQLLNYVIINLTLYTHSFSHLTICFN